MSNKITSVAVAGVLVFALGTLAVGQRRLARVERLKEILALTDAQVSEIRALIDKHQQAALPLRQQIRAKNRDLRTALSELEPNTTEVGQIVIARQGLQRELRALNRTLAGDIGAALTPEQRQKFQRLRQGMARPGGGGPR